MDTVTADGLTSAYDVAQSTEYFDNLGNVIQTVSMQASPLQNDMVAPVVYDNFGRRQTQLLPYTATTNDGNYKPTALTDQINFNSAQYPGEQYYYSQINFEPSPLNRVSESFAPGQSWVGSNAGASDQYLINATSDSVQIWQISSTQMSLPVDEGAYPAGQLLKYVVTDEQGHQVIEYKDKLGKVILMKIQQAASPSTGHFGWLCTYYVYDTLQNLRIVIQPQAVSLMNGSWSVNQTISNQQCFRYEYDGRRRLAISKLPGAGQTWMVYDARDRMVMVQDSVMRVSYKWKYIKYDAEDRPDSTGLITDPTYYDSLAHYDTLAYYSTNFPSVSSYTNQLLTQNFYDDYSWVSTYSAPVAASMATTYLANSSYFNTTYNTSPTYAYKDSSFSINRGMLTGTMQTVVGPGITNQYLYTAAFYDDRGRIIQTQKSNYTGAIDTMTMQYNFCGKRLRELLNHKKVLNTSQNHIVVTKLDYDQRFRLRHVWKNIDNAASDQLIDSLQYDELGQLTEKYLGNQVDSLIYSYNIRGWLTGINRSYVSGTANHYFGMELGYNSTISVAPGNTYLNPQLNGNIEGVVWKSAGSQINRKYDFTYDPANRLTSAAFLQNSGGTWNRDTIDFSVSNIGYDANGNLLTMTQRGFTVGGSAPIDSLTYSYLGGDSTNVLMGVVDAANNDSTKLGDFHYNSATKQSTDYSYDGNGNLLKDNNKNIDSIVYNYMNLPQHVHFKGEGYLNYVYDAAGNKLLKTITDSIAQRITTITYVAGFVYQQTAPFSNPNSGIDTLQFVRHEEGRIRWAYQKYYLGGSGYSFQYDFFEKDHLGNTRMVLTQERDTTLYRATMEAANRTTEEQLFGNIANTCAAWTSMPNYGSIPSGTRLLYTNPNDSVSKVDSSSAGGQKTGPSLLLKVMSGDSVNISAQCYYTTPGGGSTSYSSFSDVLTSLSQGLANLTGGAHGGLSNFEAPGSNVYSGLTSFLNGDDTPHSGYPQAYINYIFLDDQFNYVSSLSGTVLAASATNPANQMNLVALGSKLAMNRNGYLYIWVSNQTSGWDVYFDNLSVEYQQGPVIEENHYYPYGLTMAALDDKAIKTNYTENRYRYSSKELQNSEFSDGTGLEQYDFGARLQDPQLGVWHTVDPLSGLDPEMSPYSFALDDPINITDEDGMKAAPPLTYNLLEQQYINSLADPMGHMDWDGSSWAGGGPGGGAGAFFGLNGPYSAFWASLWNSVPTGTDAQFNSWQNWTTTTSQYFYNYGDLHSSSTFETGIYHGEFSNTEGSLYQFLGISIKTSVTTGMPDIGLPDQPPIGVLDATEDFEDVGNLARVYMWLKGINFSQGAFEASKFGNVVKGVELLNMANKGIELFDSNRDGWSRAATGLELAGGIVFGLLCPEGVIVYWIGTMVIDAATSDD
jgi:RHS repeat-associated protein